MSESTVSPIVGLERIIGRMSPRPERGGSIGLVFTAILLQETRAQVMERIEKGGLAVVGRTSTGDPIMAADQVIDLAYEIARAKVARAEQRSATPTPAPRQSNSKGLEQGEKEKVREEIISDFVGAVPEELREALERILRGE